MKYYNAIFLALFFLFTIFVNSQEDKNSLTVKWNNGLKIENHDKSFKLAFGGFTMIDHSFFSQSNNLKNIYGPLQTTSGAEIRRARLFALGTIYSNIDYKLDISFEGGRVGLKDVYIGINSIPIIGNVRIGNVKEPIRLDVLTSSKFNTFMERSFIADFSSVRNNGILMFNDYKKFSYQAGLFRNANGTGNDISANNGWVFTSRLTGLPIDKKNEQELLHLGVSYSYRKPNTKNYIVASKPEANLSSIQYISTGEIDNVSNINIINLEAAYVKKAFSLQSEYLTAKVNRNIDFSNTYDFSSYYIQASYFLTGENKTLKNSYKGFGRIIPKKNFMKNSGAGAWEVAFRYSYANLISNNIIGGKQSDFTAGLNWYLNPVTRVMLNHVLASIKDKGNASVFQVRFQVEF